MFNFDIICEIWITIAILVFITLLFITAPYGRHSTTKWGPMIANKWGWVIMESPSLFIMLYFWLTGTYSNNSYITFLFILWITHYINRTFIFPFHIKTNNKKMPLLIVINAILFNIMNAGLNGYYLAELSNTKYTSIHWFMSNQFYVGAILFILGAYINISSDQILIKLRDDNDTTYKIPEGGLFKYVASPNLFGEIIEWMGFAIMAWNLPAFTFFIWTLANLVPRAISHYQWNQKNIPGYPKERKIVFPGLF